MMLFQPFWSLKASMTIDCNRFEKSDQDIVHNFFFRAAQKKASHMSLERHEGE